MGDPILLCMTETAKWCWKMILLLRIAKAILMRVLFLINDLLYGILYDMIKNL
jgi:hypothetical protein